MADRKLIVMNGGLLQQLQSGDNPVAPTQSAGDNSTRVATTAFVQGTARWIESNQNADFTVSTTNYVLYTIGSVVGGYTGAATLASASGNAGLLVAFKLESGYVVSNPLTIGNGSDLIDGSPTCVLTRPGDCVAMFCTGSEWLIVWDNRRRRLSLPGLCYRRLTLESGVPISTSNQSAKGTIYWTPDKGRAVALYSVTIGYSAYATPEWDVYIPPEIAFPLSATSGKNYDLFANRSSAVPSSTNTSTDIVTFGSATGWSTGAAVQVAVTGGGLTAGDWYFWNAASTTTGSFHTTLANALSGTSKVNLTASITARVTAITMSQSAAWTNDTTRADALGEQDGVITSGSDATKLWLGGYRASASNVTAMEFSGASPKMFVSNWFNPEVAEVIRIDTTASWTYATNTWRQGNNSANNQIEIFTCTNAFKIAAKLDVGVYLPIGVDAAIGIGVDSVTPSTDSSVCYGSSCYSAAVSAALSHRALGYRVYKWCENRPSAGTAQFYGENTSGGLIFVRSRLATGLPI